MLKKLSRIAGILFLLLLAAVWWMWPARPWGLIPVDGDRLDFLFAADGRTLLLLQPGSGISLWDVPSLQHRASLPDDRRSFLFSLAPDGRKVAFYVGALESRLWNPDSRAEPFNIFHFHGVAGFTRDSRAIVTGDAFLYDTTTGEELPRPQGLALAAEAVRALILQVALLADGRILVLEDAGWEEGWLVNDRWLNLWDLAGKGPPRRLRSSGRQASLSPDGRWLVDADVGHCSLRDLETGLECASFPSDASTEAIAVFQFSPDGRFLAVRNSKPKANGQSATVYDFWDLGRMPPRLLGTADFVQFAFSSDSRRVTGAPAFVNGPVEVIELPSWQRSVRVLDEDETVPSLSPDGKTQAVWSRLRLSEPPFWLRWLLNETRNSGAVRVSDAADGREVAQIPHGRAFAYAPDSQTLAVRTPQGIEFWDIPPRRPWWIDYGLPVVFAVLLLFGVRLVWRCMRVERIGSARVFSPGGAVQ